MKREGKKTVGMKVNKRRKGKWKIIIMKIKKNKMRESCLKKKESEICKRK